MATRECMIIITSICMHTIQYLPGHSVGKGMVGTELIIYRFYAVASHAHYVGVRVEIEDALTYGNHNEFIII